MGFLGACFVGHMYPGVWCQFAAAGFVLNGSFRGVQMMSQTVRKIELHKDGKTVTLYPGLSCIGKFDCQIKDIKKLNKSISRAAKQYGYVKDENEEHNIIHL